MIDTYIARVWPPDNRTAPFDVSVQAESTDQAREIILRQYGRDLKFAWGPKIDQARRSDRRSAVVTIGIFAALTVIAVLYLAYVLLMAR
jgi:hypothetical protein